MRANLIILLLSVFVSSCLYSPRVIDDGVLVKGRVVTNGYYVNNLYIKVLKVPANKLSRNDFDIFDSSYIVDSIKINKDGTYQKYFTDMLDNREYILVIYNDSLMSNVETVQYLFDEAFEYDFYLRKFCELHLQMRRSFQSSFPVDVKISGGNYFQYNHKLYGTFDTIFIHRILEGEGYVYYELFKSDIFNNSYEKHSFSESFYSDYEDEIYYTIDVDY